MKALIEIAELEREARDCFARKDIKKIRHICAKLRSKLAFDEAHALLLRLTGEQYLLKGKIEEGRAKLLEVLNTIWGEPTTLERLRTLNAAVTPQCKLYELTIRAGVPSYSYLGAFTSEYVVSFFVVAQSGGEALTLVKEVCRVVPGVEPRVVACEVRHGVLTRIDRRGVYACSPFSLVAPSHRPARVG